VRRLDEAARKVFDCELFSEHILNAVLKSDKVIACACAAFSTPRPFSQAIARS